MSSAPAVLYHYAGWSIPLTAFSPQYEAIMSALKDMATAQGRKKVPALRKVCISVQKYDKTPTTKSCSSAFSWFSKHHGESKDIEYDGLCVDFQKGAIGLRNSHTKEILVICNSDDFALNIKKQLAMVHPIPLHVTLTGNAFVYAVDGHHKQYIYKLSD